MRIADHMAKAHWIEDGIGLLNVDDHVEAISELCMIAGTHLLNATLHATNTRDDDVVHSDVVRVDRVNYTVVPTSWDTTSMGKAARDAVQGLADIERFRTKYVRGPEHDRSGALEVLQSYSSLKDTVNRAGIDVHGSEHS